MGVLISREVTYLDGGYKDFGKEGGRLNLQLERFRLGIRRFFLTGEKWKQVTNLHKITLPEVSFCFGVDHIFSHFKLSPWDHVL